MSKNNILSADDLQQYFDLLFCNKAKTMDRSNRCQKGRKIKHQFNNIPYYLMSYNLVKISQ